MNKMVHRCDINTQQLMAETNYEYRTTDIDQLWTKKKYNGEKTQSKKDNNKTKTNKKQTKNYCVSANQYLFCLLSSAVCSFRKLTCLRIINCFENNC